MNEPDPYEPHRGRGLTPGNRELILAGMDVEYERQQWYRVRQRFYNTLLDATLLLEQLPEDQLARWLSPDETDWGTVYDSMVDMVALFVASFYDRDVEAPDAMVNRLIEQGVKRAVEQRGLELHQYEPLSYSTEPDELEDIKDRFLSGEELSYAEFQLLQRQGVLSDLTKQVRVARMAPDSDSEGDLTNGETATSISGSGAANEQA